MWTKLKLLHKGLILISVPLVFELIFVGLLYYFYSQANEESARQAQSKEFVGATNKLSNNILQSSYALLSAKALRSEGFLRDYDKFVAEIPKNQTQLEVLAKSDPRRELHVKRIKLIVSRILQLTQRFRQPTDSVAFLLENPLAFRTDMEHNYRLFFQQVDRMDTEEEQIQTSSSEKVFRDNFKNILVIGIGANFAITIWLVLLYSKNITGRLEILADNAQRLSQRTSLNKPLSGDDEITALDQSFHLMASELGQAEQRKQDFVAMISHDLRSPLTSVQTSLALVSKSGQNLSETDKDRLANASRNIRRINSMLQQLLDMEKLEAGMLQVAPALTDLASVITQAVDSVSEQARDKQISIKYEAQRLIISADSERLVQVVINLLSNAIKFAPNKSAITIKTLDKANTVTVSVIDHGPGIPRQEQQNVFDRFHQIKDGNSPNIEGSGLGLAIARALVLAHAGSIGVKDTEGGGSTFWFTLPSS